MLLALVLSACGGKKTRPAATDAAKPAHGAPHRPAPVTRARPDRPGEYTAGGLYKPGVPDGGPPIPPDISHLVEPEPTGEPRARYGNRSPYTVLGKNYHVMENADGYVARGIASWYGAKFHGRATSSLEPYDMYQFTAAHKSLPLPTHVRVTHLANGRSVVVRVNDRGPFHEDRLIDLSYAAAVKLGMHIDGTAPVEIRVLKPGETPPAPPAPMPAERAWAAARAGIVPTAATTVPPSPSSAAPAGRVWLQVASFTEADNARRLVERLEGARIGKTDIQRAQVGGRIVYRVRVGPFVNAERSHAASERVHGMGLGVPTLITE
ncbi:septal ring lytic transglycosylase RlpA family protein [Xanthomonadaceae bacterium JHOS43]|nr:septal ring lytic transglycosylase RlpA family protein [Xanthomonadaceae bacterium JHOS43]